MGAVRGYFMPPESSLKAPATSQLNTLYEFKMVISSRYHKKHYLLVWIVVRMIRHGENDQTWWEWPARAAWHASCRWLTGPWSGEGKSWGYLWGIPLTVPGTRSTLVLHMQLHKPPQLGILVPVQRLDLWQDWLGA